MVNNVGFDWGFKTSSVTGLNSGSVSQSGVMGSIGGGIGIATHRIEKPRVKRRLCNDEMHGGTYKNGNGVSGRVFAGTGKRKPVYRNLIQGQPLPMTRSIELMDRSTLQSTLLELVRIHPEIQESLMKVHPMSFSIEQYERSLKEKLERVLEDVPYSKYNQSTELLNDYAFGRMKGSILEFLNSLIDYLLASIPPRADVVIHSLKFLNSCTELLIHLPEFETESNNYYKNMCLEQVSEIWCSVIQFASADLVFTSMNSNWDEWESVLQSFNRRCNDKLTKPLQLIGSMRSEGMSSGHLNSHNGPHFLPQNAGSTVGFLNISS